MLKEEEISILNLIFERVYNNNDRVSIKIISAETLEFAFSLYRIKTGEKYIPLKFYFKGKELDPNLSLINAGLSDNSIIITNIGELPLIYFDISEPSISIIFEHMNNHQTHTIRAKPNWLVKELICIFMIKTHFFNAC